MRLFFGLELDAQCAMQVADWRDRQLHGTGRPVPPANFHITLAFIGETKHSSLERLSLSVDTWLESATVSGNTLNLDCTGYWHKPGIYWLGPQHWPDSLSSLAGKLRSLGVSVGGRRDRNVFTPHITLFRGCHTAPPAPPAIPPLHLAYDHFTLFESRPGKQGVNYHIIDQWQLPTVTG